MQRRLLVLAVYDPKWFMQAIKLAKRRGIAFSYYYPGEDLPRGSVVYTDFEYILGELEGRKDLLIIYDPQRSCKKLEEAILASMYSSGYRSVIVGVDPGDVLSYVILGDDYLLLYGEGGLKDLDEDFNYVLSCVPHDEIRVKVGTGHKCGEVVEYIKKKYVNIPLELVDETSTSPSRSRIDEVVHSARRLRGLKPFRHKDIYAAYRIALSKGVEVL
ncbi:MAG: hypothetical protein QXJ84_02640 [Desulfurococcaceae archaeon]